MKKACIFILVSTSMLTSTAQNFKKAYTNIIEGLAMNNKTEQAELFQKSIDIFNKGVEKDTTNATAHFGLAVVYAIDDYAAKDYFKAWNSYQKAEKYRDQIDEDDAELMRLYFTEQDVKRRNKKLEDNFEIEKEMIEDKLIRYVREENNLDMAHRFIKEYPESRYLENVVHIRNYLEFRKAEKENTISGFQQFMMNYPDAAQIPLSIKHIEKLAFNEAKSKNTIEAYNAYIQNYKDSKYHYQAVKLRDKLAFDLAKTANSIDKLDQFMNDYPNSMHFAEARDLKMKLVFEKAKSVNTLEAYNEFVEMYPEGQHYIDIFNLKANALGKKVLADNRYDGIALEWIKSFDKIGLNDRAYDLLVDGNNEILIAGTTQNKQNKKDDIWFLKLDVNGRMIWNREMGDTLHEKLLSINQLGNNDFVAAGKTGFLNDSIKGKAWILGANMQGGDAWNKEIEANQLKSVSSLNHDFFIAGGNYLENDSLKRMYVAKVRKDGKTSWQRYYSTEGKVNDICTTDSMEAVVCGSKMLFMLDKDGYIKWEILAADTVEFKQVDFENETVLLTSLHAGSASVSKFDRNSNLIWTKSLGLDDVTNLEDMILLADRNILVAAIQNDDVQLVWMDNNGEIIKKQGFGTTKKEHSVKLYQTENALFMLLTIEYRSNDSDILVAKMAH